MLVKRLWNTRFLLITALVLLTGVTSSVLWVGTSRATPGSGVTREVLSIGKLSEPVAVKIKDGSKTNMDVTQIQTYKITIAPGGYTGWHQHGGPHLIVVKSGTLTYYKGDDPTCTGVDYPAGSAILDAGFDTHFVRNQGSVDVVTYVTQLLPEGGTFGIDVPDPGNCSF